MNKDRVDWEDLVAHLLAVLTVCGFFGLALLAFSDHIDLTKPEVLALLSTVIGYMSGKADRVLARYFKDAVSKKTDKGEKNER